MRKLFFCVILFCVSNVCYSADRWEKTYMGTIGRYTVGMYLARDGVKVQGEYFYIRHKKSILLRGEIEKDGTCIVREFNEKGEPLAEFIGKIIESNDLNYFQGTWKKIGAINIFAFSFSETSLNYKTIQSEKLPDFDRLAVSSDVQIQTAYPQVDYDYLGFFDNEDRLRYWILSNSQNDKNKIFDTRGGHTEIGTPVSVSKAGNSWQIGFIGMKVNSPALIGNLFVTLKAEDPCGSKSQGDRQETTSFALNRLMSTIFQFFENKVYACGCGTYITKYGSSKLIYWGEAENIQWYRLENPIPLAIYTGEDRAVGLQIYFQPTGGVGKIRLSLTNVILQKKEHKWAQAEVTGDGNEKEFRAIIVPVEMGECDFVYDKVTRNLNLEIFNKGEITLKVDGLSFTKLCEALSKDEWDAQWSGARLESFDGAPALKSNVENIGNLLRKVNLKQQDRIIVPIFQNDNFSTKTLYFPVLEFNSTVRDSANTPVSKGRLIKWWLRSYSIISNNRKKFRNCIPTAGNELLTFYSGVTKAVVPIAFEKKEIAGLGFNGVQYIPRNLGVFGSKFEPNSFNYHWSQSDNIMGFEWGILMPETIENYLKHHSNSTPMKEMKDFYGYRVVSFEKGNVVIYLVDRPFFQSKGIRYQIPKEWQNDFMLMSVIRWMILINPSIGF